MGQNIEIVKLQIKRGPEAQLPTLDAGEPAITTDTHKIFIGDGTINHELAHKVDLDATNVSLADIMSLNNYTVIPTFTNGQLTKVEEKDGSTVKASSTLTYNSDGTVNTVTELINGKTVITTLNYTNGEFLSITRLVV
jgi:hypothetical protein